MSSHGQEIRRLRSVRTRVAAFAHAALLTVVVLAAMGSPLAMCWASRTHDCESQMKAIDRELNAASPIVASWVECGRVYADPCDPQALRVTVPRGEWASLSPAGRRGATLFLAGLAARRPNPRPFLVLDEEGEVLHKGDPARLQ